jgi:hypothetical protein
MGTKNKKRDKNLHHALKKFEQRAFLKFSNNAESTIEKVIKFRHFLAEASIYYAPPFSVVPSTG